MVNGSLECKRMYTRSLAKTIDTNQGSLTTVSTDRKLSGKTEPTTYLRLRLNVRLKYELANSMAEVVFCRKQSVKMQS